MPYEGVSNGTKSTRRLRQEAAAWYGEL